MYPPPRPIPPRPGVPAGVVVFVGVACSLLFGFGGCAVGAALATDPATPAAAETTVPAATRTARSSTPTATVKPKPKEPTISAGTWRVPQEVKPGTWRTTGGDGCYWERLRGFSGRLSDIIANESTEGAAVVTIKASDKGFSTHGCAAWKRIGK